jgi:AhpD family alkylhydroperoxidase
MPNSENKRIKRIFNLDTNAFKKDPLIVKIKEQLNLLASSVLRCDDCVQYHLEASYKLEKSSRILGSIGAE